MYSRGATIRIELNTEIIIWLYIDDSTFIFDDSEVDDTEEINYEYTVYQYNFIMIKNTTIHTTNSEVMGAGIGTATITTY